MAGCGVLGGVLTERDGPRRRREGMTSVADEATGRCVAGARSLPQQPAGRPMAQWQGCTGGDDALSFHVLHMEGLLIRATMTSWSEGGSPADESRI